jgi:hypothetical protein
VVDSPFQESENTTYQTHSYTASDSKIDSSSKNTSLISQLQPSSLFEFSIQPNQLWSSDKVAFLTEQIHIPSKNRAAKPPIPHSITVIFVSTKTQISTPTYQIQSKSTVNLSLSPAQTVPNPTIHQNHKNPRFST